MYRQKPFTLSAECIYDEYGFLHPGFDPLNIYWIKSIYYRDVSSGFDSTPCTGIGYYVNLDYSEGQYGTRRRTMASSIRSSPAWPQTSTSIAAA